MVVVLDDDEYIHDIWKSRIPETFLEIHNVKLFHFYEPDKLINFCKTIQQEVIFFLLDYDLKSDINGLILAADLGITTISTLVTSRYEDSNIREDCQKLSMKILPKTFAEYIPINIIKKIENVFIDDEEVMTSLWKESAENAGKKLSVFNDPRDFMRESHLYDKATYIYLDSSLGGDLRGEDFAKILYEKGYRNLILSTSFPKEQFKKMNWLKSIIGKEPPWNQL